jgi:transposase
MLMPPNLEEKVPQGHLSRFISRVVDQLEIEEINDSYSDLGCRAYNPRMLLKILIYGYATGIRSSRRIQKEAREDLVFMWLAGMQEPDFRTISDFRKDRIVDIKGVFRQVLAICGELGMVRCGRISIDGTKIEASSSRNKLTYRKMLERHKEKYEDKVQEILEEAEKLDAEEDKLYGESDGYSGEHVHSIEEIRKALKKVNSEKRKLECQTDKVKSKIAVIDEKIERMGKNRNSYGNTDTDATLMLMKEGHLGVGYNVQMATENQVIVGYGVYQRPNDVHLLQPMIEEIEQNRT